MKEQKDEEKKEEEVAYLGNIWGWNLTYKMLVFLVAMLLLVILRSWYLGVNPFIMTTPPADAIEQDSIRVE